MAKRVSSSVSKPYTQDQSLLTMPADFAEWPQYVTQLITEMVPETDLSGLSVQFPKMDKETRTAIGAAVLKINQETIRIPIIIVMGDMYPLDIAFVLEGSKPTAVPWHPVFVRIINSSRTYLTNKSAFDPIDFIMNTEHADGLHEFVKKAMDNDIRIKAGFYSDDNKKAFIDKFLDVQEVNMIKINEIKKASFLPNVMSSPAKISGGATILTTDGPRNTYTFDTVISPFGEYSPITVSDKKEGFSGDEFLGVMKENAVPPKSHPNGRGVFWGTYKDKIACSPIVKIEGKVASQFVVKDLLNRNFVVDIKNGSDVNITNDTMYIPGWHFAKINEYLKPQRQIKLASDGNHLRRKGSVYYINEKEIGVGKEAAVKYLKHFYSNSKELVKAASQYFDIVINDSEEGKVLNVSFDKDNQPISAVKLASMLPSPFSAAAVLGTVTPIPILRDN